MCDTEKAFGEVAEPYVTAKLKEIPKELKTHGLSAEQKEKLKKQKKHLENWTKLEESEKYKKCEDNWLGVTIYSEEEGFDFSEVKFCPNKRKKYQENHPKKWEKYMIDKDTEFKKTLRIIVILESPHKEEYKPKTPMPALGATGRTLSEHFTYIFNNWVRAKGCTSGKHDVILMNAIQYQTSLGAPTDNFRDGVFTECWDRQDKQNDYVFRTSFSKRLKTYLTGCKEAFIINMCTKGNVEPTLREMVQDKIRNVRDEERKSGSNKKITLLRCSHPSSWRIPKIRKAT